SDGLSEFMENILGTPIEKGGYSVEMILLSMAVGIGVTLISAVLPAFQAGKVSPLEALRKGESRKESRIHRFLWIPGLLLLFLSMAILIWNPFPYDVQFRLGSMTVFMLFTGATLLIPVTLFLWQYLMKWPFKLIFGGIGVIGIRNIERSRNRTMLTVAALMVGVSMIVTTQGITGSFRSDLEEWMDAYLGGDIFVNSTIPVTSDLRGELEAFDGVQVVSPSAQHQVIWVMEEEEEQVAFMGIDPIAYSEVTSFVFADDDTDEEAVTEKLSEGGYLVVSEVISSKYGVMEGDRIWLKTVQGNEAFEVAAVVLDYSSQGQVMTGNLMDLLKFFDIDEYSSFSILTVEGSDVERTAERLKEALREDYDLFIETNTAMKSQANQLMQQAFSMFDVLGILSVMVAALGVLNTLTMSVVERTQEIGMLRTMGMTRFQIVKMIESEAGLLGIIGGVLGLILGLLLTWIILGAMGAMSGYQLDFMLPLKAVWMSIVVALVTSFIAALVPALKAARTPMLSAIHYE
ncbi:MAG TPA: FtsX-like permease family protein, partial [Bacteroidales bacterium]|nr:FtsX-like permease family protein [Bacteroidales bacterium]